jgi:hypothetical protein
MIEIFVSYRADDSVHATMAISDELALHVGRSRVFRDHDSLALGVLYPQRIRLAVARCDTLLAVIGPHWLDARDARGRRRIDEPRDWVRTEIRMAFERHIPVVPILLDDTALPAQHQLPDDIRLLSLSNYWRIRHQTFAADMRGLIGKLDPTAVPASTGSAGNTQHNSAAEGGAVYATQGGNQTIYVNDLDGKDR